MIEILSTTVDNYQLTLKIKLRRISKSGYPVYSLDLYINEQPLYDVVDNLAKRYKITLLYQGLNLLEPWCKSHPNTYLCSYDGSISTFVGQIHKWGARCDGRVETWFTFINLEGERVIFPGVLNPIEDCLDIDDLWRVAKDYNYFLGELQTPVDWLLGALNTIGYRNLLESGYCLEIALQTQYANYQACFEKNQARCLTFAEHPLNKRFPINVIFFCPKNEPEENKEFRFYLGCCLIAAIKPNSLIVFEDALPEDISVNEESILEKSEQKPSIEKVQAYLREIANHILTLDPFQDGLKYH